jgi:hypothetical protein
MAAPRPVALRPLGIGEMLDAAIKIYRRRPKPMIIAAAVVVFPAIVLQTFVQVSAGSPDQLTPDDPATLDGGALATYLGGLLVSTVILLMASNLALAGTTRLSLSAYLGDDVTWRESLRFAFRRFWSLTGLLAVTTLGLLVGTVACIAPGLWLQGIWAVAVPALLVEGKGAGGALSRSQHLVRGRFWPVIGTVLIGSLLASFLQGVLIAPVLALQLTEASFVVTALLTGVVQLVGVVVTMPFTAALSAVIYVDLRVRKEAYDLELMASGLGADLAADAGPAAPWAVPPARVPEAPPGGWGAPAAPAPVPAEPRRWGPPDTGADRGGG